MKIIIALLLLVSPVLATDDNVIISDRPFETTLSNDAQKFIMMDTEDTFGVLWWRDGTFHFEGNATSSAREFLNELNRQSIDFCK